MTPQEIKTFGEEFDKRFPNLNDSTNEGGYDAKEYVKSFFITHATALIEERKRAIEELPAFTPVDRGYCSKVSDKAKKPRYDTNYLERETILTLLTDKKDS